MFKALQTYSNGDIVRWIDLQQPGQSEPEHPAPVLLLTSQAVSGSSTVMVMPRVTAAATTPSTQSSWPGVVAVVALVVALLALGAMVLLRRSRMPE